MHLPWCLRKCPYCDFNSHEFRDSPAAGAKGGWRVRRVATMWRRARCPCHGQIPAEGREARRANCPKPATSTPCAPTSKPACRWSGAARCIRCSSAAARPACFPPAGIDRLLGDLRLLLPLQPGCEITLEANPGTFEKERFRAFRAAGVTRLSIGVQSFDDAKLEALGRVHSGDQARAAVEEAAVSFETFNLDLMYALPGQRMAELEQDLRTALSFNPPHLSLYHLTLEPNTAFARRPPVLPDDDTSAEMMDRLIEWTGEAGLQRYEVSAYARPGHRCTHNLNYWQFGDYLGLGAGAHGKLSFPHRVLRQVRWREPAAYMDHALAGNAVSNEEEVQRKALPFEFMLNALRLKDGFELALLTERTGLPPSALAAGLKQAREKGMIEDAPGGVLRPTARGFDFLSDLQGLFL